MTLRRGREARSGARWLPTSSLRSAVPANHRPLPAWLRGKSTVVSLAAHRLTIGMKGDERPLAEGLDLRA
jgi:hypothetical protein